MSIAAPIQRDKKALFAEIVEQTASKYGDFQPIYVSDHFAQNRKGNIQFNSHFYTSEIGDLRSVHVYGPRIEIINIFFFPESTFALPIFAMEFVIFGDKPVVAAIDIKSSNPQQKKYPTWNDFFDKAHNYHPCLTAGTESIESHLERRSDNEFFLRPKTLEEMYQCIKLHYKVWHQLCAAFNDTEKIDSTEVILKHRQTIQDYKRHHRLNSHGLPFLNTCFGTT